MQDKPSVTEALRFYANRANWEDRDFPYSTIVADNGERARAALSAAAISQSKPGEVGAAHLLPTEGTELRLIAQDGAHEQDTDYVVKSRQALWKAAKDVERLTKERDVERKHVARLMRDLDWNRKRAIDAEAALSASHARIEALQAEVDRLTADNAKQVAARNDFARDWDAAHKRAEAAEARLATVEKEAAGMREALARIRNGDTRDGWYSGDGPPGQILGIFAQIADEALARSSLHAGETPAHD